MQGFHPVGTSTAGWRDQDIQEVPTAAYFVARRLLAGCGPTFLIKSAATSGRHARRQGGARELRVVPLQPPSATRTTWHDPSTPATATVFPWHLLRLLNDLGP